MGRKPSLNRRDDLSIKMERAVVEKARVVAAHRKMAIAEVISSAARGVIDSEYMAVAQDIAGTRPRPTPSAPKRPASSAPTGR